MQIQLHSGESVRLHTYKQRTFLHVHCERDEYAVSAELNARTMHVVVIKKDGLVRAFAFQNEEWASEFDFGWWADGTKIFESE